MKITTDTNFLVSATQWDNSSANKILVKLINIDSEIFTTQEILDEFRKVLKKYFNYELEEIENIIQKVLTFLTLVEPDEKLEVVKEDIDDNKIIECAVKSKSDYILSYDNHLLKIREYNGIKIIRPEEINNLI